MAKEPGQIAWEALTALDRKPVPWEKLWPITRAEQARVEAACRASALEEAAKKVREHAEFLKPYAETSLDQEIFDDLERAIRSLIPRPADGEAG